MKFYITTALAYVNAPPHMGHAFQLVRSDAIARYHRLIGDNTFLLTGTDEYGSKLYKTAKQEGINPQKLVDRNANKFQNLDKLLNISYDDFIRTTDKTRHWPGAQLVWRKIAENGDLYKSKYKGDYCSGCEAYLSEKELQNGKCLYHDAAPERLEEENYFFKLSRYADKLTELIESEGLKITPDSRKKEALSIIKDGLRDVSFSRPRKALPWGIPVPGDNNHVMYVWCDALTNYISALGYGSNNLNKFNKYWPADLHVIGKDNLRFHALYWPAMLMSAGITPPKQIYVHGFITSGGKKMSKSIGNVIDPFEIAKKYGTEPLRYYLLKEIPVAEDGDFTIKHFEEVYNADLANGLGNTVSRVTTMAVKYLNGQAASAPERKGRSANHQWKEIFDIAWECVDCAMKDFNTPRALAGIWHILRKIDEDIDKNKPWKLAKQSKKPAPSIVEGSEIKNKNLEELIYKWLEALNNVGYLLRPFLPETSDRILKMLNVSPKIKKWDKALTKKKLSFKIKEIYPLFLRRKEDSIHVP